MLYIVESKKSLAEVARDLEQAVALERIMVEAAR